MDDFQGISHTVQYILGSQAGKVQVMQIICKNNYITEVICNLTLVQDGLQNFLAASMEVS
jgi:hypothetical protein